MKLKENDKIPNSEIFVFEKGEPTKKKIEDLLKSKKAIIFGLPGAYTSVCSAKHLPGYVNMHKQYKDKGIDLIICIAVNDPFVMNAWGKENNVGDKTKKYSIKNSKSRRYKIMYKKYLNQNAGASKEAPVEETTFFSSIFIPGNEATSDPVAITIFFVLTLVLPLLLP